MMAHPLYPGRARKWDTVPILQKKTGPGRTADIPAPSIVHDVLRGAAQPLDANTRALMEPRFGQDFSQVRVHADDRATESARAVNALAYTVGRDVVFGAGQYTPATSGGQRLLAHELTHVAQQGAKPASQPAGEGQLAVDAPNSRAEQAAQQAGDSAAPRSTEAQAAPAGSAPIVQCQPAPGEASPENSPAVTSQRESLVLDGFAFGKAELSEDHTQTLVEAAASLHQVLRDFPNSFINIVGHTDAVGDEERNESLGMQRAEAVRAALVAHGIPAEALNATSLGERSLMVQNQQREPRNRRVEVLVTARPSSDKPEEVKPTPNLFDFSGVKEPHEPSVLTPKPGHDPNVFKPIPSAPKPGSSPLDYALDRDPLLRKLPGPARKAVKDAIKRADETLAKEAIKALDLGGMDKSAVTAAVVALLRTIKGERWNPPTPPLYEPPPATAPKPDKAPGEKIFTLPPIPWDFPYKNRKK